jgi:RNA polymerase sigma-70 factor (ECF subfamily)
MSSIECPLAPAPARFEEIVLPHLDAARRLARWLVRDQDDAEDAVQEASLRALQYIATFTGGNGRAWFLTIVRNTCARRRAPGWRAVTDPFDEELHSSRRQGSDPETLMLRIDGLTLVERAIDTLPHRSRDLLVLRELEGLSYRELADVMGVPIGTVMSGLSRARQAFRGAIDSELTSRRARARSRRAHGAQRGARAKARVRLR